MRAGVLVGGDTGEFTAGDGPGCEYGRRGRPPFGGCRCGWGKHAGCGWWWMVGTLLGPEGTTVRLSFSAVGGLLGSFGLPGMTWGIPAGPCGGGWCWCLVVGCGLVVG
jgi:hypothetical protein